MELIEIKEKVKNFLCTCLGFDPDTLDFETSLVDGETEIDSIDEMDLISYIDQDFNVSMTNVDGSVFKNISTIAEYIKENM